MADCCAELRSELAALRAEVARLKPVDENSIIKKAIEGAQALLKPEIAGVAVVAAGAVKQSGIATNLAQYATTEAFQATAKSRSAAVVAELAKKSAQGAVSLSEIASMKAGNAFSTATKAQAESAIAKALSNSANTAATAATAKATIATRAAAVAQGVATTANTLANSALGKVILLAANVLSLAGSIAGLFALYATLKIVFPRLDAHDRQLLVHDNELSKHLSLIGSNANKIKEVEKTADKALKVGEEAYGIAQYNDLQVRKLKDKVEIINGKANTAIKDAEEAKGKAEKATDIANEATAKSLAAIGAAKVAEGKAERAEETAIESFTKSLAAINQAGIATGKADFATGKATTAEVEAKKASDTASTAIKEVTTLKPQVSEAQQNATEAKSTARVAVNTADTAINRSNAANQKADNALGQIPPIRDKADTALSNSQGALLQSGAAINISATALNLANNALNRVPTIRDLNPPNLRSPELESRINRLETKVNEQEKMNEQVITKIDNLPRIIEPTIVNSVTKTVNAVVPISIEQASADIKNTFENISIRNQKALEPQFQRIIDNQRASNNEVINSINTPLVALPNLVADRVRQIDRPVVITQPRDTETLEKLAQVVVGVGALKIALDNMPRNIANSPAFQGAVTAAATTANCRTAQPGGCTTRMVDQIANNAANNANNNLLNKLGGAFNTGANAAQLALLQPIKNGVDLANRKLGAPIANGGISGFLGRLSSSLGIDRALNLIGIASNLHNAMMLSASLKVTLLEMLSSVGNATGLLQTSENENVDLNQVFNQGIETFMVTIMGAENYAGLKVNLRKYNAIYRAATNSLNATASMFNSIGDALETAAEYTGKIGNALRAASVVRENAYNFMSEHITVKTSKFMTFQTKVGDVTQVLETINEIAENVVEGQEQYTEAVKATTEFKKALADADRPEAIDNKLIKAEAEKIKANLVKDPTGEDETGLLSFLTDL